MVAVGGGVVGVDLEGHAIVLDVLVALVVGVLDEGDFLVVVPLGELVRPLPTGASPNGLRVLVEGLGQRGEAESAWP